MKKKEKKTKDDKSAGPDEPITASVSHPKCGGAAYLRIAVFAINFIFLVAAVSLLIYSVLLRVELGLFLPYGDQFKIQTPPVIVIVLGILVIFVTFMGCYGALAKSSCILTLYCLAVLCVMAVQLLAGFLCFQYVAEGSEYDRKFVEYSDALFQGYANDLVIRKYVDYVHQLLECCGFVKPAEWGQDIPQSCCPEERKDSCNLLSTYESGCKVKLTIFVEDGLSLLGYLTMGCTIIEFLAIILAAILICCKTRVV